MPIDAAEVRRIAELARLHVEPGEAIRLARDLDRIVGHIDQLRAVDLPPGSESLTYFGHDAHREDRAVEGLTSEQALANAPETDGFFFLVPKILDREEE